MPNCEIEIEFYRPDREFRTGESIQGWARIAVDRRVQCRELHLVAAWATQGRGNPTKQNYHQQTLFQGQWQPGEIYEYPFEFMPLDWPLTYHGQLFRIHHYVAVRADLPWAVDPRREESFWLLPGTPLPPLSPPIAPVTQPRGGLLSRLLLATGFGKSDVQMDLNNGAAFTGCDLPIQLTINPSRHLRIDKVTAIVEAFERVQSSPDRSALEPSHLICRSQKTIGHSLHCRAGESIVLSDEISIPDSDAYSVRLPNVSINWLLTIRARVAKRPELRIQREISVMPKPIADGTPNPVWQAQSPQELLRVLRQLTEVGKDTRQANQIIRQVGHQLFEFEISVDHITESSGQIDDVEYQNGRTIVGSFAGTEFAIAVHLPQKTSHQTDHLTPGSRWIGCGTMIRWEPSCNRIMVLGL